MIKTDLFLPYRYNTDALKDAITARLPLDRSEISDIRILRRELVIKDGAPPTYKATVAFSSSVEREKGLLKIRSKVSLYEPEELSLGQASMERRPVVVGFGPAGLFAALSLAEAGACPIVLERGLSVDERAARINLFSTLGLLDTECNVQFGEGGAGTYSDGKLKCGSRDRYKMKVLGEFVLAGADESILYSTSAHLGTDKLPGIVKSIREKIIALGGEVIFGAKMVDLGLKDNRLCSVIYEKDGVRNEIETDDAILATGHSARDTLLMMREKGIQMSAKGFGIGVRIEHPREYINKVVYRDSYGTVDETASYHLVTHLPNGRSVYSFCMCPGGTVVAATSESEGIVTNGMSEYRRDADNSNCALLVSVTPDDFASSDPLAGIELQRRIERCAYALSGSYKAPAWRLEDLLLGGVTNGFGDVLPSYPLGTEMISPSEYLPDYAVDSLKASIVDFDEWMPGFNFGDAVLTGPETRTTSPVRIERDSARECLGFVGIYPAGEGAGYAGGIVSSAVDGIYIAESIISKYKVKDN